MNLPFSIDDFVRITHRFGTHPEEYRDINQPSYGDNLNKLHDQRAILRVINIARDYPSGYEKPFKDACYYVVWVDSQNLIGFNIGLRNFELELVCKACLI